MQGRFWKAFFFPCLSFLFFVGVWPFKHRHAKNLLERDSGRAHHTGRVRRRGVCITDAQAHGAWLKVFWNHQKISKKYCFGMPRVPKIVSFNMCVGVFFVLPLYNLPLKSLSFCKGPGALCQRASRMMRFPTSLLSLQKRKK